MTDIDRVEQVAIIAFGIPVSTRMSTHPFQSRFHDLCANFILQLFRIRKVASSSMSGSMRNRAANLLVHLSLFVASPCVLIATNEQTLDAGALSVSQLEQRLQAIDSELDVLAHLSLRSGIGAIGYRSRAHDHGQANEWIEIDLGEESSIDEVVLVPTIRRDTNKGFRSDAFPLEFKIVAGSKNDREGTVIAEFNSSLSFLPRIAPLRIPTPGAMGSWIRIEANELSSRSFDGRYVLQLSEVIVFCEEVNIALNRPLKASSNVVDESRAWSKHFLVDGFLPYLMDSALGSKSLAYISKSRIVPTLSIDLGGEYLISQIHLHSVEQSATVPQAYAGDLGIPSHLVVEGALLPDFSDASPLLQYRRRDIIDIGPIIIRRFSPATCRYIRLVPEDITIFPRLRYPRSRIGFAEIELFSNGHNVALGKTVTSEPDSPVDEYRSLTALTDGHNLYGQILPFRRWINELSRRHDLEMERPIVADELNRHYLRQKKFLQRTSWLAVILALGIGFVILFERKLRARQAARLKQRFAADLHDELGANLHAIGVLCDLAKDSIDSRDRLTKLLDRARAFTERSGMAARYCTSMLEAEGLCEDLVEEMKRTSQRLLADLESKTIIEGKEILKELAPRKRIDMFLFYKESLTNIIRHSGATNVVTHLIATEKTIRLTVSDNGQGIAETGRNRVPPSLKRRARLLRAKVVIETPLKGGTRIVLDLKNRKRGIFLAF